MTSWEYPSAHGEVASPVAAPKKKLSLQARAQWRKILDYARREATSKLQSKSKRFLGLRKFADQAAKRKAEAAEKKRKEKEEEEAANAAAAAEALRPKKSIMEMLDVDTPPIEKQNIEEFADAQFNLNRKGFFGKKTTVAKVLSWKNELIRTSCVPVLSRRRRRHRTPDACACARAVCARAERATASALPRRLRVARARSRRLRVLLTSLPSLPARPPALLSLPLFPAQAAAHADEGA